MGLWHWDTDDYPAPKPFADALSEEKVSEFAREIGLAMAVAFQRAVLECMMEPDDPGEEV